MLLHLPEAFDRIPSKLDWHSRLMWPKPLYQSNQIRPSLQPHYCQSRCHVAPFWLMKWKYISVFRTTTMIYVFRCLVLPFPTSHRLTFRSAPPVATNGSTGLQRTAFTSPSCASYFIRVVKSDQSILRGKKQKYWMHWTYEFQMNPFRYAVTEKSGSFCVAGQITQAASSFEFN